jgi:hypothetical protein
MKFLIYTLILAYSFSAHAQNVNQALATQFQNYANQSSAEIDGDVMSDVEKLAPLRLNKNDLDLVKNVILTLVKLDKEDPSRTAVMMLSESYGKNKKLYKEAFAEVAKTGVNKTQLKQIEDILENFNSSGNG